MNVETAKALEAEQERQRRLTEMNSEEGAGWAEQYRPGTFGCHELLDRTAVAADTIEEHVMAHPACLQNAEWFALAEQAVAALRDLYQRVGAEHFEEGGAPSNGP